mmetsp:Transcript_1509/g.4481  ORF Transcript_1509/g.4481 Transcript_1509/m.4481 type:complete len:242 (-) Transcript_1509:450-1175(-)
MQHSKSEEGSEVLAGQHSVESHYRNGRSLQCAHDDEWREGDVEAAAEAAGEDAHQHVYGDDVDHEAVPSPAGNHVPVRQPRAGAPCQAPCVQRLDVEEEHKHQGEDGNTLIVVRSRHRSADVGRHNAHKCGTAQAGSRTPDLIDKEVCGKCTERREERRREHAHLLHVDRKIDCLQEVPHGSRGEDDTWVDSASDDTAQRVPGVLVKPIPKVCETLPCEERGDAVIEVWIKLVNHRLVLDD